MKENEVILTVKDLHIEFHDHGQPETAVEDFDLTLRAGEIVGIVGESGSGKSMSALAIAGLLRRRAMMTRTGEILFEGKDLLSCDRATLRSVQGAKIAMIFQEPMTSLNPVMRIGRQVGEILKIHYPEISKEERKKQVLKTMSQVGLRDCETLYDMYPHELSGGMRQRVMIAIALACQPKLLIADEPTTALDVTIQAQILDLMQDLKKKLGMGIILITHDLGVVASMCDHIAVMYAGEIVEYGTADDIFYRSAHEYTKGLLRSIPKLHEEEYEKLVPIEGQPVDLLNPPEGCAFASRCDNCMKICLKQKPDPIEYDGHYARCWMQQKKLLEEEQAAG